MPSPTAKKKPPARPFHSARPFTPGSRGRLSLSNTSTIHYFPLHIAFRPEYTFAQHNPTMPALYQVLAQRAVETAPHLAKRGLSVNHTQSITLGVMAVYVVVIALLWNLPYVRWSLWPFKVSPALLFVSFVSFGGCLDLTIYNRCWLLPSTSSAMRSPPAAPVAESNL